MQSVEFVPNMNKKHNVTICYSQAATPAPLSGHFSARQRSNLQQHLQYEEQLCYFSLYPLSVMTGTGC